MPNSDAIFLLIRNRELKPLLCTTNSPKKNHKQNVLHRNNTNNDCRFLPLLFGEKVMCPKIVVALFFDSVNVFEGTDPAFLYLKFSSFRNFLTADSLRTMPVNSCILAEATLIELGGCSVILRTTIRCNWLNISVWNIFYLYLWYLFLP